VIINFQQYLSPKTFVIDSKLCYYYLLIIIFKHLLIFIEKIINFHCHLSIVIHYLHNFLLIKTHLHYYYYYYYFLNYDMMETNSKTIAFFPQLIIIIVIINFNSNFNFL